MARIKTSPTKKCNSSRGFTLLEIMVVLGIIGAILALGVPRLRSNPDNLKKITRELFVLGKEIRNQARLKNRTYRIVFNMPPNAAHSFWVESAEGPVVSKTVASQEKERNMDERDRPVSPFQKDERLLKKDRELPSHLFFGGIEYGDEERPVSEGTAYVYFLPQGLVQLAAIHFTDKKNVNWTLTFNPLTGQADIIESHVTLKELAGK